MTRDEMIEALKARFPLNHPASWSRCSQKKLCEWCEEYAILSREDRKNGVIAVEELLTGRWGKMYPKGIGAYPYACIRQDEHPDAMVYEDVTKRTWQTVVEYEEMSPGYYRHPVRVTLASRREHDHVSIDTE